MTSTATPVRTPEDVLVVGGGPAGCVAATLLARAGVRVAIRPVRKPTPRPVSGSPELGLTLPPPARLVVARLGLEDVLDDTAHLASPGTVSAWGGAVRVADFLSSPYGDGLHLDVDRFGAALLRHAIRSGARLDAPAPSTDAPGTALRVLVDATGRAASIARSAGWRAVHSDRLVALVATLEHGRIRSASDARTLVAAEREGWWYTNLLPDRRRVAAFLTDRDLPAAAERAEPESWFDALLKAEIVGSTIKGERRPRLARVHVVAANSRRLREPSERVDRGEPVVVPIGDAAMAFDPLSSLGILAAIESAADAVPAVLASLSGDQRVVQGAQEERVAAATRRWTAYREELLATYAQEQRWPGSPFWARRHRASSAESQ